ncbi:WD40-repeat-containing domain protein [Phascolomyces articulosus]|uniref:WD40-repeat-containing domain protein n=1 Tax=Phascolomyces articulosus TaxID=60185 RepID=A0AAD5JTC3_9FUNG|nr:WD40-repeat-containing domain protein [Phascolomyces articulosus]
MSFDFNTYCYKNNNDSLIDNELQDKDYLYQTNSQQNGLHQQVSFEDNDNDSKHKTKRGNKSSTPTGPCYFQQLSVEIVIHIFARLDPNSLKTVAKVCRHWRYIATDDTCWKNAFLAFFGTFPFKRLRKDSWKLEYIYRTDLIRIWEKGRGTVMQFNPKIGSIQAVSVDLENAYMLVASAERGLAVKCNPVTGSVDRHMLYSTDDGVPLRVNAVQVEGQRILWGFNPGYITMTTRPKSVVGRQLRVFAEFHQGAVTALALPSFIPDIVLSAGEDGAIKIWDVPTISCAKSFVGIVDTPTCLEVTRDYRIVAGYTNGTVVVWNIRVDQLVKEFREQLRRRDVGGVRVAAIGTAGAAAPRGGSTPPSTNILESRRVVEPTTTEASTPVQSIKHDSESDVMLVAHIGSHEILKYKMSTGERLGVYGGGGDGHTIGTVTCMEWDISPATETESLQTAMKMYTKKLGTATPDSPSTLPNGMRSSSSSPSSQMTTRLLITGDSVGTICVWDGDAISTDNRKIKPLRVLHGHLAPISALFVDSFKIVSGSDDGWIRIWDPVTGSLVNVLGNKIPKNAPVDRNDVSMMRVTNIHCDDYRGVATIGHQVKSWDFSSDKQMLTKRNLKRSARVPAGGDSRQLHYEIRQEWKESAAAIQQEKREREREVKELNKLTLGGLSDEEMLAYGMMLSQEESTSSSSSSTTTTAITPQMNAPEEEDSSSSSTAQSNYSKKTSITIPTSDYIDEDDEELMMAMIASMETASIDQQQHLMGTGSGNGDKISSNSSISSSLALSEDLSEWPSVNNDRKWQKSSSCPTTAAASSRTIWNGVDTARVINKASVNNDNNNNYNNNNGNNDEYDDELQYVLRMSQKEF